MWLLGGGGGPGAGHDGPIGGAMMAHSGADVSVTNRLFAVLKENDLLKRRLVAAGLAAPAPDEEAERGGGGASDLESALSLIDQLRSRLEHAETQLAAANRNGSMQARAALSPSLFSPVSVCLSLPPSPHLSLSRCLAQSSADPALPRAPSLNPNPRRRTPFRRTCRSRWRR